MKRIILFILCCLLITTVIGCENKKMPSTEPGIAGYVTKQEEGRILVVASEPQDFSATGGIDEFYNAIWFKNVETDVQIGDQVKVWFEFVMESYPGQSEATHIEVISADTPDNAMLTEAEALRKALLSQKISEDELVAVKAVKYDSEGKNWHISLKNIMSQEEQVQDIYIEDK